ncbi:DUF4139 domain-containing protein [Actinacidiphila yeochonensis]|uniref:DUF4139 domain-containing protein n=1 Tax=Actinacidiphila yeochonensis TaxID=89050 RepID=UPI00068942FF|nr:DUF4139 domain-containing protein [Actinacidiphila yeochonensis]
MPAPAVPALPAPSGGPLPPPVPTSGVLAEAAPQIGGGWAPAPGQRSAEVPGGAFVARSRAGAAHPRSAPAPGAAPVGPGSYGAAEAGSPDAPGPAGPAIATPPRPAEALLDYAALSLAGPDDAARGTLRPGPGQSGPGESRPGESRPGGAGRRKEPWPGRPAHTADVRTAAGSFDYRFDAAAPVDIASDGRWHTVPVGEADVRTESGHVCVPALDTAVYATVDLTNTSPHALLAGPVDVLVDGRFVLTAPLPTLAPGQRESVGLGVAESVQAVRRARVHESTAGLRGGTTVLDHRVEVELANRLPYPVVVEVRERVPVSTDKDVRIEPHRAEPAWEQPSEQLLGPDGTPVLGARVWRVPLEPGRTAVLKGGYELRVPAAKQVDGGNRRT